MRNRLKEIRKSKKMNQEEFSKKLGISRSHLAGLESGAKNITDRLENDICRIFNVNKAWFENGTGEMFNDPLEDLIIDDEIREMAKIYKQLDDNVKKTVLRFMKSSLDNK